MRALRVALRLAAGLVGLVAVTVAPAAPAHADGIRSQGETWGDTYHFGQLDNGWVSTEVGVEFYVNDDYDFIQARGYAVIDKEYKVRGVRIDKVRLGVLTAPGGVLTESRVPALDRGGSQAAKESAWVPVTENIKKCGGLKLAARAYFTVRWADGRLGSFSVLSKSTTTPVCKR